MAKTAKKSTRRTKTVAYDVAEQLRTPEEIAAYLDAWFVEAPDDAAGIARALGDIARARGMTQVARDAGLSRESLYKALSGGAHVGRTGVDQFHPCPRCGRTPMPGRKRARARGAGRLAGDPREPDMARVFEALSVVLGESLRQVDVGRLSW